jgi:phosphoribosyl-ATP pyrophosphohydrolase
MLQATLDHLTAVIKTRRHDDPTVSYIAKRFARGRNKMAQKIGEEGVELAIAVVRQDKPEIVSESADLLFHMMLALEEAGLSLNDVAKELARRDGISGLEEKQARI